MDRRRFLLALPVLASNALGSEVPARVADAAYFPPVLPGSPLVFPDDCGAHPEFRTEWWYATGWLTLPDGQPLGFQSTFFRVRTGIGDDNPSAFAPRQLILAHAAIADPKLGRLRHDQRSARTGLGLASYAMGRTAVSVGDWSFEQVGAQVSKQIGEQIGEQQGEHYQAEVRGDDFAYSLSLRPAGPPMRNGAGGFSTKAPDPRHASYYYSRPQLVVTGTVTLDGRQQAVTGKAWLDHEWSSELLPADAQGWDWVGLNFDDGGALMAFRMRDRAGKPIWAAASLRGADGRVQVLAPEAVAFLALRHWRSPRTGIDYPIEWQLNAGGRRLHLAALIDDQELDSRRSTGAVYWEGAVRASENGREIGRGYLEMTGYGEKLHIG